MAKIVEGENLITDEDELIKLTPAERYEQEKWWVKHQDRSTCYPSIGDQLDMQYHDGIDGTTVWADTIAKLKADNSIEAYDVQAELAEAGGIRIDSDGKTYDSDNYNSRAEEDAAGMPVRGDNDTDDDIRLGTTSRQKEVPEKGGGEFAGVDQPQD